MIGNDINKAIELLDNSKAVAIPTETVYGLAARIDRPKGIEEIFTLKERPFFDPLIIHVKDKVQAKQLCLHWPEAYDKLAQAFWPGPLTLIAPKKKVIDDLITAGLPSVGLRCPAHPVCRQLLQKIDSPLAAPSANKFKKTSPTLSAHVQAQFQDTIYTLEGGACEVGIESTIVEFKDDELVIYRPGMISKRQLEDTSKCCVRYGKSPVAPGQLEEHYRPKVPFYLIENPQQYQHIKKKYGTLAQVTLHEDAIIAARKLYAQLHELGQSGQYHALYLKADSLPRSDDWQGLWDRLKKAASTL